LAERRRKDSPTTVGLVIRSWRRLTRQCGKMPWELRREDVEGHAAWLREKGYAASTINHSLGNIASFYRWCDERLIDPECPRGFNPAAEAERLTERRYEKAEALSREEVERLLRVLEQDQTPLGRRDRAFFLARLRLGIPLRDLRELRWGQIEGDENTVWLRHATGRVRLPADAWEAMQEYLRAAGRMESIGAGDCVFAPLANPPKPGEKDTAGEWAAERCMTNRQVLVNLSLYGRAAGIPEAKLTNLALRHTAVRLRLEAGDSVEEMRAFMGSREPQIALRSRLRKLPRLPSGAGAETSATGSPMRPPNRRNRHFQPGEGMTHGLYAQRQPVEAVQNMMKEDIRGVKEEMAGMRRLAKGLLERQMAATRGQEAARLANAYTMLTSRLAGMIQAGKPSKQDARDDEGRAWAIQVIKMMDKTATEETIAEIEARLAAEEGEASGDLREEIAACRYVLRKTLALAEATPGTHEYITLAEVYSTGCSRLIRLLKAQSKAPRRLAAYLRKMVDEALREFMKEYGIGEQ